MSGVVGRLSLRVGRSSQLSELLRDFPSTFPVAGGPSVNFSCIHGTLNFRELSVHPRDFTSILHASVNFRQLSVRPGELCQLSLRLRDLQ